MRFQSLRSATALFLVGFFASGLPGVRGGDMPSPPPRAKTDSHGDPLPAFARARFGNVRFQQGSFIQSLQLWPDGKTLVAVNRDQTVRLWNLDNGREVGSLPKLPRDRRERDGLAPLRGLGIGAPAAPLPPYRRLAISPDGRIAAVTAGTEIQLWDMVARKPLRRLTSKENKAAAVGFYQLTFTPDGKKLAAISQTDETGVAAVPGIFLWNVVTGEEENRILFATPGGKDANLPARFFFSPDGQRVMGLNAENNSVYLYDWPTRKQTVVALPVNPPNTEITVNEIAFSPDSKQLALLTQATVKLNADGLPPVSAIYLVDAATGKTTRELGKLSQNTRHLIFSPQGKLLAVLEENSKVRRWETATGKELPFVERQGPGNIVSLALAPDERTLALGIQQNFGPGMTNFGTIQLWDGVTGQELHELYGSQDYILTDEVGNWEQTILFTPDGKTLIAPGTICIRRWDVASGKEIRAVAEGHAGAVTSVAVSPDGRWLATLSTWKFTGQLYLWDIATGQLQRTIDAPVAPIILLNGLETLFSPGRVVFAPDGKTLAIGWPMRSVTVHETATGRKLREWKTGSVVSLAFLPNGRDVVSGDMQGRVSLWNVAADKQRHRFAPQAPPGTIEGMMGMMGMMGGQPLANPAHVAVSPDGRTLAATMWTESGFRIQQWEIISRKPRRPIRFERLRLSEDSTASVANFATQLVFTPNGRALAMVTANKVLLIDLASGKEVRRFGRTATPLLGAAFSTDGKLLAAAGEDGCVHWWDVASGTVRGQLAGHLGAVAALAFLPDGRGLVSASHDSTALIWDVAEYLNKQQLPPTPLSDNELRSFWKQLADDNPEQADQAADRLADVSQQTVAMLRREVSPAPPVDPARIARLVGELENDLFSVRRQATVELEKLGVLAESALRKRLADKPPLETRRRIEQLLEKLTRPLTDPIQLRAHRAVALLERIDTPEARAVLRTLANGEPEAPLTRAARDSLDRGKK